MSATIGFVGLGAMGMPMTRKLAEKGYRLEVYDLDEAVRARAAEVEGVRVAESAAAAASRAEVLFTCLPNDAILSAVHLGEGGIAAALAPGSISVDCSTVSPAVTQEIHEHLAGRGVSHVDAAMLGSVPQAEAGEIGFVVGGERDAYEDIVPLLEVLGRMHKYVGASGAANRVKLIHQVLVAGHAAMVGEAMGLCLATGTDIEAFYDVVCNGGGFATSRYFERRVPRMRDGDFSPLFMLELMAKDIGLARELADAAGLQTPILARVIEGFEAAKGEGWGREDFSAVAHLAEKASGRKLTRP